VGVTDRCLLRGRGRGAAEQPGCTCSRRRPPAYTAAGFPPYCIMAPPVRWGIMGTARIADSVHQAMVAAPAAQCVAVASRTQDKAAAWAEQRGIPSAYGSYAELLGDANVDAVYIPLPTTLHLEWVTKAALAKKHVLVEKPVGLSEREVQRMVEACRANGVQFMDNVMFMHNERLAAMAKVLSQLGEVRRVTAVAGFKAGEAFLSGDQRDIRTQASADPLGCLGDVGWYNIRAIMFANGWELPKHVIAHALEVNEQGVVLAMAGMLIFDRCVATFDCGFDAPRAQHAEVVGTRATLSWDGFIGPDDPTKCSYTVSITGDPFRGEESSVETVEVLTPLPQAASLVQAMSTLIQKGGAVPEPFWPQITLKTQRVVDAVHQSWQQGGAKVAVAPVAKL
jgi:predicted dehydrogenase